MKRRARLERERRIAELEESEPQRRARNPRLRALAADPPADTDRDRDAWVTAVIREADRAGLPTLQRTAARGDVDAVLELLGEPDQRLV